MTDKGGGALQKGTFRHTFSGSDGSPDEFTGEWWDEV